MTALEYTCTALPSIRQELQITLRYAVHFTWDLFNPANSLLCDVVDADQSSLPRKLIVVVDQGVVEHHCGLLGAIASYCVAHSSTLRLSAPPLVLPGGEAVKNDPAYITRLQQAIHEGGICRHSYIVAIGGGALLDMAGYAAATAHRGVRLIRVPTTVLAQNDSGVGVKTSVNAFGKKNFLGTFTPPAAVLNDLRFLTTLSQRDWLSGLSEAIKVALIKDPGLFLLLEQEKQALLENHMSVMQQVVHRCAELHMRHIATAGDPFEQGSSRPLDFGHWAAHKLEQLSDFRLRHGEAVAVGIALDSTYSYLTGLLSEQDWRRIVNLIAGLELPIFAPELLPYLDQPGDGRCVLSGLSEFREHLGGELTIMLLRAIGRGHEVHQIDYRTMAESVRLLEAERCQRMPR